jgi:hypothetical protein
VVIQKQKAAQREEHVMSMTNSGASKKGGTMDLGKRQAEVSAQHGWCEACARAQPAPASLAAGQTLDTCPS